ncbi:MAG TPA: BON domain-containing protein [Candidatus Binataceae bacterium]|nr:BON domain-containing protein [Candidatus Binataceae bacterium]
MRIRISEIALALIFFATLTAGCGPGPKGETAGSYLDDSTVTAKVKAAIALDSRLSDLDIRVETDKGIVQLSGFVDSPAQAQEATHVASGVAGVKSVHNSLIVRPHTSE